MTVRSLVPKLYRANLPQGNVQARTSDSRASFATTSSRTNFGEPTPSQDPWAEVVPECNDEHTGCGEQPGTTERDVEVGHDPEVVREMPCHAHKS